PSVEEVIDEESALAAATINTDPPPPPAPPPPPEEEKPPSGNGRGSFDDFGEAPKGGAYPHGERESGRKVAQYIYRDLKGRPYLKVATYVTSQGKKSFPQYHLENGQWVKGKPEGPAIPYQLPELLAAPANAHLVICEGEKDAETAAKLGFIATTNPGGAGK